MFLLNFVLFFVTEVTSLVPDNVTVYPKSVSSMLKFETEIKLGWRCCFCEWIEIMIKLQRKE